MILFKAKLRTSCLRSYKQLLATYIDFSAATVREEYRRGKISLEEGFYLLEIIGYCPILVNDDNYHWAVIYDGCQTIPDFDKNEPIDVESSWSIEKHQWKKTIREAFIYSLEDEI